MVEVEDYTSVSILGEGVFVDTYTLCALVLLEIFAFTKPKDKMTRPSGIVYVALYAMYMVLLFVM